MWRTCDARTDNVRGGARKSNHCEFLVAPQGFEPRLIGSEPTVLPLNEGAAEEKRLPGAARRLLCSPHPLQSVSGHAAWVNVVRGKRQGALKLPRGWTLRNVPAAEGSR